jgi:hypothetical protein
MPIDGVRKSIQTARAITPAAAALRLLLLRHASVNLLIEGLKWLGGPGSLVDLARACDQLDHELAPVVFFTPVGLAGAQDDRGRVDWSTAGPGVWRTTTGFQLKSVLRHAGILSAASSLGSSTMPAPATDLWSLGKEHSLPREPTVHGQLSDAQP